MKIPRIFAATALFALFAMGSSPDDALKALQKQLNDNAPTKRAEAAAALGKSDDPSAVDIILKRLRSEKAEGVVVALLDALKAKGKPSKETVDAVIPKLSSGAWQVVITAAEILATTRGKETIAPLIDALARAEKQNHARLKNALNAALAAVTGKGLRDAVAWKSWWEANKENFAPPEGEPGRPTPDDPPDEESSVVTFYEIPIESSAFLFVIDKSGSMDDKSNWKPASIDTGPKNPDLPQRPDGDRKIDIVKYELVKVLLTLPLGAKINIICYDDTMTCWKTKLTDLDKKTRADAVAWVKALQPHGATNIFDSLELAFSYAGAKPAKSPQEAKPGTGVQTDLGKEGIDTIYLLSDGIANRGKLMITDEILKKIREMNAVRKITLHAVAVGSDADETLMENLAKQNGGKYVKH